MLATHNPKTINANVEQPPLCTLIKQPLSPIVISSQTIGIRKMVWCDDMNHTLTESEEKWLNNVNANFFKNKELPNEIHNNNVSVYDAKINLIHLYFNGMYQNRPHCVSLSPITSSGVMNEIIERQKMRTDVSLITNCIESNEYKMKNHGRFIYENNGKIKSFTFPNNVKEIVLGDKGEYSVQDEEYVILDFELLDQFVGTGMVSFGLPSVVNFGSFVNNTLQRYTHADGEIKFALGFTSIKKTEESHNQNSISGERFGIGVNERHFQNNKMQGGFNRDYFNSSSQFGRSPYNNGWVNQQSNYESIFSDEKILERSDKKANLKGYIVMKPNSERQKSGILEALSKEFKISGKVPTKKNVYVSKEVPKAFWLSQMNDEVSDIIKSGRDSLDASFDFYSQGVLSLPVISGFALLSSPQEQSALDNFRFNQAWAESLLVNTELEKSYFDEKYLFQRKYNSSVILWCQNGLEVNI